MRKEVTEVLKPKTTEASSWKTGHQMIGELNVSYKTMYLQVQFTVTTTNCIISVCQIVLQGTLIQILCINNSTLNTFICPLHESLN